VFGTISPFEYFSAGNPLLYLFRTLRVWNNRISYWLFSYRHLPGQLIFSICGTIFRVSRFSALRFGFVLPAVMPLFCTKTQLAPDATVVLLDRDGSAATAVYLDSLKSLFSRSFSEDCSQHRPNMTYSIPPFRSFFYIHFVLFPSLELIRTLRRVLSSFDGSAAPFLGATFMRLDVFPPSSLFFFFLDHKPPIEAFSVWTFKPSLSFTLPRLLCLLGNNVSSRPPDFFLCNNLLTHASADAGQFYEHDPTQVASSSFSASLLRLSL